MTIVVGWREWVALPGLGIGAIRAKVDTGARTSALHVDRQWRFTEGGMPWVGFELHGAGRRAPAVRGCAPVADERWVSDSGGHRTRRVFLQTTLMVGGAALPLEINLSDRGGRLYPMLLGRSALREGFVVDPARSSIHGRPRRAPEAA